jgi:hypothetical protein
MAIPKPDKSLKLISSSLAFFLATIHLMFLSLILYYFQRLKTENCECALTPEYNTLRKILLFLVAYNAFAIIIMIVISAGFLKTPTGSPLYTTIIGIIGFSIILIDFIFYVLSIRYIRHLYNIACKCSDNGYRLMYLIYSIFRLVIVSFVLLMIFILILTIIVLLSKSK